MNIFPSYARIYANNFIGLLQPISYPLYNSLWLDVLQKGNKEVNLDTKFSHNRQFIQKKDVGFVQPPLDTSHKHRLRREDRFPFYGS